jgi:hypothetical protein
MMSRARRPAACAAALWLLFATIASAFAGAPADDLKQIEYRYYFRGRYPQAVEALQTFLARVDVTGDVARRAREFLAASHVLAGSPAAGKDAFARLIGDDAAYAGPDPAVFRREVVDVYDVARAEHAALTLQNAAPAAPDSTSATPPAPATVAEAAGKPIYKKWWFYAGAATLAGVVAGVAASGGDDAAPAPSGTLVVGVRVQ